MVPAMPTASDEASTVEVNPPDTRTLVDLKAVEHGLSRWLARIKRKRNAIPDQDEIEIYDSALAKLAHSSYKAFDCERRTFDHLPPLDSNDVEALAENVKKAIIDGKHPRLNYKGSSGSYFVQDTSGQVVGVFKPKDEEPYGALNPKWTKWFHARLLGPVIGFGRNCLIPNLGYLSETAASVLDQRLQTFLVPRTDCIHLSSRSFFYDWIDRRAAASKRNPKGLPDKIGSLQQFAHGFQDASDFFRDHPWPGPDAIRVPKRKRRGNALFRMAHHLCGKAEAIEVDDSLTDRSDTESDQDDMQIWTPAVMDDFRLQLEKLIVLDFCMRNTDRGLDNFMIRFCKTARESQGGGDGPVDFKQCDHIHISAIDNGLAFPLHHPKGWRNYTYGWLFLPVSMIGLPWTQHARQHFLPLLTDPVWWQNTVRDLRRTFKRDKDFNPTTFRRQIAVVKGQAYNLIESLQNPDEGPLELCQRQNRLVWDDFIDSQTLEDFNTPQRTPSIDEYAPLLKQRPVRQAVTRGRPAHHPRRLSSANHALTGSRITGIDLLEHVAEEHTEFMRQPTIAKTGSRPYHRRWASSVHDRNGSHGNDGSSNHVVVVERVESVFDRPFFTAC